MQIAGRNAIIAVNKEECMESVCPYLRGIYETSGDINGESGVKVRPPGVSSGMWLPEFISEMQWQVILRKEFSLFTPAETFKCHLDTACDPRFVPSGRKRIKVLCRIAVMSLVSPVSLSSTILIEASVRN